MSRTTIKQSNELMDSIKEEYGMKSRKDAMNYLYSKIAPRFKKRGYDLSHYKNGCFTVSNYNKFGFRWFKISVYDLDVALTTIKIIERNNAKII